jgi:hypothetical protein
LKFFQIDLKKSSLKKFATNKENVPNKNKKNLIPSYKQQFLFMVQSIGKVFNGPPPTTILTLAKLYG